VRPVDKKAKKAIQTLNQRVQKLEQQIKGARLAEDEPGEVRRLEAELQTAHEKLAKLREG